MANQQALQLWKARTSIPKLENADQLDDWCGNVTGKLGDQGLDVLDEFNEVISALVGSTPISSILVSNILKKNVMFRVLFLRITKFQSMQNTV